jgi:hypothetical protein
MSSYYKGKGRCKECLKLGKSGETRVPVNREVRDADIESINSGLTEVNLSRLELESEIQGPPPLETR